MKLIRAILKGKHDKDLTNLIDIFGGLDVLSNLRLRIKDDARLKDVVAVENIEISLTISFLHLTVIENKPLTLHTLFDLILR